MVSCGRLWMRTENDSHRKRLRERAYPAPPWETPCGSPGGRGKPGRLRMQAYPSVMPLLVEMGLVRVRDRGGPAWLLTETGRRMIAELGHDEA